MAKKATSQHDDLNSSSSERRIVLDMSRIEIVDLDSQFDGYENDSPKTMDLETLECVGDDSNFLEYSTETKNSHPILSPCKKLVHFIKKIKNFDEGKRKNEKNLHDREHMLRNERTPENSKRE